MSNVNILYFCTLGLGTNLARSLVAGAVPDRPQARPRHVPQRRQRPPERRQERPAAQEGQGADIQRQRGLQQQQPELQCAHTASQQQRRKVGSLENVKSSLIRVELFLGSMWCRNFNVLYFANEKFGLLVY